MHIISASKLRDVVTAHEDAISEIEKWIRVVKSARWTNLVELKQAFADADYVDPYVVFNIRQNRYRLVTRPHYIRTRPDGKLSEGHVFIIQFLTHREYDRSHWRQK